MTKYTLRPMEDGDIPEVLDIWRETGMLQGVHSLDTWHETDPGGIYVAEIDGLVIGSCSCYNYSPTLAFMGLFAVRKQYQGLGIGLSLWKKAQEHAGDRNIGLNAVEDHLHTYQHKAGFGVPGSFPVIVCVSDKPHLDGLVKNIDGVKVEPITEELYQSVIDYDKSIHLEHDRSLVLKTAFVEGKTVSRAAVDEQTGDVLGYGSIKEDCQGRGLIGPLYANSLQVAEILVVSLIENLGIDKFALMTSSLNPKALILKEKMRLEIEETGTRLYTQKEEPFTSTKLFGFHDLNFCPM